VRPQGTHQIVVRATPRYFTGCAARLGFMALSAYDRGSATAAFWDDAYAPCRTSLRARNGITGGDALQPGACTNEEGHGGAVRLDILQVPDCPNAAVLETRLALLLADHPGIEVTRHVVTAEDDAERLGMTGSPTLLVDGADPFARPDQRPTISCRLYPDEQGRPGPAPSLRQLREALRLGTGGY